EEADHAGEARAGLLVDELDALVARGVELLVHVIRFEADVMHALPAGSEELCHAGIVPGGLEQFYFRIADGEEYAADALVLNHLVSGDGQAKGIAIELECFVRALHDDADMMDLLEHCAVPPG